MDLAVLLGLAASALLTVVLSRLSAMVAKLEARLRWDAIRGHPNSPMARAYQSGKYNPDAESFESWKKRQPKEEER